MLKRCSNIIKKILLKKLKSVLKKEEEIIT